ncbi:hypothetical protein GCM10011611_46020 [Aliidongia dinghuensis]|uniref:Uncharacterized protein n=2 Tax=Aliidongia dinghuensis TaxID=1867774 RepID=A0A8J2YY48_9PROT|nr:hypothetical protein GCM10011611_46020 [Aliidongia dinghuensis]
MAGLAMTDTRPTRSKLRALEPALLRPRLKLPPDHAALYDEADGPGALLDRLVERRLLVEAARLLAYALPPREAVWWSCMCVDHAAPADLPVPERQALDAAEAWVRRPDAENRRQAAWAAAAAGYQAPGAWAALAAYWSRPERPDDLRGGRGVETAVDRTIARHTPAERAPLLASFIASGRDIARGGAGRLAPTAGQRAAGQKAAGQNGSAPE